MAVLKPVRVEALMVKGENVKVPSKRIEQLSAIKILPQYYYLIATSHVFYTPLWVPGYELCQWTPREGMVTGGKPMRVEVILKGERVKVPSKRIEQLSAMKIDSICTLAYGEKKNILSYPVLRNRAILTLFRFRFQFRLFIFLHTGPAPVPCII